MSETLKTIKIHNGELKSLFAKIMTQENVRLVRGRISSEVLSHNVLKKILRCFNEKKYPPGKVLLEEGT